ncbi:AbrB/MazE/SpoVT family DNA-binding domain-containing protein [Phreatobacter cathodiphilus]|nr:AbrB/MazE/SpoVT family DNA-binding domain-containing protein [Phreatobacter cathodiphilus]
MTSKGQLTLPVKLRESLNLKAGDEVVFIENEAGTVVLAAGRPSLASLRGVVRLPEAQIDEWIDEARSARGQAALPVTRSPAGRGA